MEIRLEKLTHDVEEAHRRIGLLVENDKDVIRSVDAMAHVAARMSTNPVLLGPIPAPAGSNRQR